MRWRSAKSAPRDGREFLACCDFADRRELRLVRYDAEGLRMRHYEPGPFIWRDAEGRIAESIVTHWVPAPELPR
jgi:hypothetical protein